jgi:hypothetical protein
MNEKKWLSALKPLAHNTIMWNAFEEMIDYYVALRVKELEQAEHTVNLHRAQGAIASLKKLKTLRDEINAEKTQ